MWWRDGLLDPQKRFVNKVFIGDAMHGQLMLHNKRVYAYFDTDEEMILADESVCKLLLPLAPPSGW